MIRLFAISKMFIAKGNLQQYFRLVMQTRIGHFMVGDIVNQQVAHQKIMQLSDGSHHKALLSVYVVWTPDPSGRVRKGLGNNFAWKCLECWNAAVSIEEVYQATYIRVLLIRSEYTVERGNFENWNST